MKRKQPWMFKGATVLALGKKGTITEMETNTIEGVVYVYYIHVTLLFQKGATIYHPNDIEEVKQEKEVANDF